LPQLPEHLRAASANDALSLTLEATRAFDWSATLLFYATLHMVDAFLAQQTPQVHPASHSARRREFMRFTALREIWPEYRRLENRSRAARYELTQFSLSDVQQLRAGPFSIVRARLAPLIGLV
jgi:hypothetical protein